MSNKITTERNQRALLELASQPGNDLCADCKARNPRWASYNLGIFVCVNCASIHRKIGTHVSKVKSLTLDSWSKEQVENMKQKGNIKSNSWYNPNETRNPLPTNYLESERDSELELYIRSKYEHKRFLDRSAVVASHLGPSRSSSALAPRAQSTPVIERTPAPAKPQTLVTTPEYRLATAVPAGSSQSRPTRSVSQPLTGLHPPPQQQQQQQPSPQNPVWDDLISLQTPNAAPSLPLQYQPTPPVSAAFASLVPNPTPFGNFSGNPGYPSPLNSAGGYPPVSSPSGMNLPQLGVVRDMGMSSPGLANPFQKMQQQQAQAQQGFTTGPSMFLQSGGASPNPFAQAYPLTAGSANFGGGMGGASPMQSATPFQQSASAPSFQPSSQTQVQPLQQHSSSFGQQGTPFQPQQQPHQYLPAQQQAQQFFQPQPQPLQLQQQTMGTPPFIGTPSPFDYQQQHQQQQQAQMYPQGFGGWPQGGQWGGM